MIPLSAALRLGLTVWTRYGNGAVAQYRLVNWDGETLCLRTDEWRVFFAPRKDCYLTREEAEAAP